MLAFRRGLRLVSGWKAFGDAENTDAESGSRRFYVLQLGVQDFRLSAFITIEALTI